MQHYESIRRLLQSVRARWRALRVLQAVVRAGVAVSIVLALAILATRWIDRSPVALALVGVGVVVFVTMALVWAFAPLRQVPGDAQVARYIEERRPELDDRLATAVDAITSRRAQAASGLFEPLIADAARRVEGVEAKDVVPAEGLRQGWFRAFVVAAVLGVLAFFSSGPARQVFDAAVLTVFPSRVTLQVAPGNARIRSGSPLGINARLVGTRARVAAQVEIGDGERWRTVDMTEDADGRFRLRLESVTMPFKYRVLAGSVTSPTYSVAVAHAPRVTRVDLDYTYPADSGLAARTDEDSGDIYAPPGTSVRLHVHVDRPVTLAVVALDNGQRVALAAEAADAFAGNLTLAANGSYRVVLAGADGLISNGDTEYFIRLVEDPPPDVRILKPAADRSVTPLDEVEIEAQAEDRRAIEQFELVYSVRGEAERIVPLTIPKHAARVTATHLLRLEALKVQAGDSISYYARARQAGGAVARSDIYFLEVGSSRQEPSRASGQPAGSSRSAVDDLVTAQKEIVVATWKIDRRLDNAKGARPEQDIRSLSAGESELKARVEQASAPNARPQDSELSAAAASMGRAVVSLDSLKTAAALPHEMEALNHLLKAQADARRREVSSQPSDKDLQRTQQTSVESRATAEQRDEATHLALDKIKALAQQQDELLKRQQALSGKANNLAQDTLKRELEKLSREESDLRRRIEALEREADALSPSSDLARRLREAADDVRDAAEQLQSNDSAQAGAESESALDKLRELEQQLEASGSERRPGGELESKARELADAQRQVAGEVSRLGQTAADKQATQWLASEQEELVARLRSLEERLQKASPVPSDVKAKDKGAQAVAAAARELERQRLAERMQKSADDLRTAEDPRGQAKPEGEFARVLDGVADTLADAGSDADSSSQRTADQMAKIRQLRERLDKMGRELGDLNQQDQKSNQSNGKQSGNGQAGQGQGGRKASAPNLDQMRQQYERDLQQARDLIAQMKREDPSFFDGGSGGPSGQGQGMALSAPGTQAFKQDFAKWEQLRVETTRLLDIAATTLADRVQARDARRLAAGASDRPPAGYQQQVDSYFKALAAKKKP